MADRKEKLLVGPRLRRLRQTLGLTQLQMAEDIGVSTSYINLIERNQRPISAKVLIKLAEIYDFEMSEFSNADDSRTVTELYEILRDPLFSDQSIGKNEAEDMVNFSPEIAQAFLKLYTKYRDLSLRAFSDANPLVDREKVELLEESARSVEAVREFIHNNRNYFPSLDEAAEKLSDELRLDTREPYTAMVRRLSERHSLTVRILSVDVMDDKLRYFDRHLSSIHLSELLPQSSRQFQLAFELGILEFGDLIGALIRESSIKDSDAVDLARTSLANYFAAALLLPYSRFLKEAERTKYDVELLSHRFGTSYEQTAHRLTTLQKSNARGIPFFFIRIDNAGNVSKRFSSGRFHFSKFGGACPLWNIQECFETPGRILTQIIQMPDDTTYFSIARTASRGYGTFRYPAQKLAIGLGCDIAYAPRLIYGSEYNLEDLKPTPIGVNCYLCERQNCRSRAFAPLNKKLTFDEHARGVSIYRFEERDIPPENASGKKA